MKGLPWLGYFISALTAVWRAPERGSSVCRTTVVHGTLFWLRVALFLEWTSTDRATCTKWLMSTHHAECHDVLVLVLCPGLNT